MMPRWRQLRPRSPLLGNFRIPGRQTISRGCILKILYIKKVLIFLGGALQSDAKASGHSLQWTKALISKPAPYFEGTAVVQGQMKELKVTDYRGKYLVFFFYPLAFTFVCPTEILAFNDRIEEFR